MKHLRIVVALCFLLLLSGCPIISSGDGTTRPQSNAEGFLGLVTVHNAKPRCGIEKKFPNSERIDILCRVAVTTANGSEVEAASIEEGTTLRWADPVQIEGPQIERLDCEVGNQGLSQRCRVELAAIASDLSATARLEFTLQPSSINFTPPPSKTIVALVAAESYGVVPHLPAFQPLTAGSDNVAGRALGMQTKEFDPLSTVFGEVRSVCFQQNRTFFNTGSNIFVLQNGQVSHYSGNLNQTNWNNFTSRKTVALGGYGVNVISCQENSLLVWDTGGGTRRLLKLQDDGPVIDLTAKLPRQIRSSANMVTASDGSLYFLPTQLMPGAIAYSLVKLDPNTLKYESTESPEFYPRTSIFAVRLPYVYLGFFDQNRIFRWDLNTRLISPYAGTAIAGFTGDGGQATSANLDHPRALLTDLEGRLIIADQRGTVLRRVEPSGVISTMLGAPGGTRERCSWGAGYSDTERLLCQTVNLASDHSGSLYLITGGGTVKQLSATGVLTSFIGAGFIAQTSTQNNTELRTASFNSVFAVAFDKQRIVAAERFGGFRLIDPIAEKVSRVSLPNEVQFPNDVRVLPDGRWFVTGIGRGYLRELDGSLTPILGKSGGKTDDGTLATDFGSSQIWGTLQSDGTLYFYDEKLFSVYRVSPSTKQVYRIAGTPGEAGSSGDGNYARSSMLGSVLGLDVASDSSLLIADHGNHRVRRIDLLTNLITTIAGGGNSVPKAGLWADEVELIRPRSVRAVSNGDIYVVDSGRFAIHALRPIKQASGGIRYKIYPLIGQKRGSDTCTGHILHSTKSLEYGDEVNTSLEAFCQSIPLAIDVKERCNEPTRDIQIAYPQAFETNLVIFPANIAVLSIPCR